ncbi:MAG: lipopolysaccharide biosynthesis protein [Lachnospiraceae bacterium]|nr:lipopolysaccharide biosynthesis protein [Lachnospiraceae bacterium]
MEGKKTAVGGFLSYFYGNFIVLLLGFVQTPLVTRLMTTDEYGRTGMFETAVSIIYIFAILGLDQAYIRYYYVKGIKRERLLRCCLGLSGAVVLLLVVLYFLSAGRVNLWLFGKDGTDIRLLVVSYTVISVLERYFFLDVRLQQNGKLYSNVNIAQKVLNIVLIALAWSVLGNDFRVVLYAMTLSWGMTTAFLIIRYFILRRGAAGTAEAENSGTAQGDFSSGELLKYGMPFIPVLLMEWLMASCDRVAIRRYSDFDALGVYTAAMKIMVLLITFKNTFVAFWSPVAMERYESGKEAESKAFFRQAFDMTRFLCALTAIGLILCRDLIVLLLGEDYRRAARLIPFLTLMPVFAILFEITCQGIKFVKKNVWLNLASAVAIIINISGNALLVPRFGGMGAAVATGLSYLVYFWIGTLLSEHFYPVGYDYLRTLLMGAVVILYASAAVLTERKGMTAAAGIPAILLICLLEKKSLLMAAAYVREKLCKLMKKG